MQNSPHGKIKYISYRPEVPSSVSVNGDCCRETGNFCDLGLVQDTVYNCFEGEKSESSGCSCVLIGGDSRNGRGRIQAITSRTISNKSTGTAVQQPKLNFSS